MKPKLTIAEIVARHPAKRAALEAAAGRYSPSSFRADGEPLYSEESLITAADTMGGARGELHGGRAPGIEYR